MQKSYAFKFTFKTVTSCKNLKFAVHTLWLFLNYFIQTIPTLDSGLKSM